MIEPNSEGPSLQGLVAISGVILVMAVLARLLLWIVGSLGLPSWIWAALGVLALSTIFFYTQSHGR